MQSPDDTETEDSHGDDEGENDPHKQYISEDHIWELHVLRYHKTMVIYPYSFLVVITLFFSRIIFINDCISILNGSPG